MSENQDLSKSVCGSVENDGGNLDGLTTEGLSQDHTKGDEPLENKSESEEDQKSLQINGLDQLFSSILGSMFQGSGPQRGANPTEALKRMARGLNSEDEEEDEEEEDTWREWWEESGDDWKKWWDMGAKQLEW